MTTVVAIVLVWIVIACALGLVVGRVLYLRDRHNRDDD